MDDINAAIIEAYRRVETRKSAERKIAEAMRARDKRDRRKYPKRFD